MTDHLSFCRLCAASCGIVVTVEDGKAVRVRGDNEHPVSRGYTCSKGRALTELHYRSNRLGRPKLRQKPSDWQTTLDDLYATIATSISQSGPDSIALYLATGLAYDSAGQVACGMWMSSIGSSSFYTAATVDNSPVLVAAERIAGHPMLNPVWEPESAQLTIFFGTNPVVSHGYGTTLADPIRRLRENREVGGKIWVLDPRKTETASHADEYVAVRPGSDVILLAALVHALFNETKCVEALHESCRNDDIDRLREAVQPFDLDRAALAAGVARSVIEQLISDLLDRHGRVAVFCGTGITMSADGVIAEWLRWAVLIMTDSLDRPGGMRFNRGVVNRLRAALVEAEPQPVTTRPELRRVAGQMPVAAMVDEIECGNLRVLILAGGNPLSAFPEPDRFRRALSSLDALVVIDVAENELTDLASHVLPATSQLERADLSLAEQVSFRSGMQFTSAVIEAEADRRPVWWMLGSLAARSPRPLFAGAPIDSLSDETFLAGLLGHGPLEAEEVLTAGPRGVDLEPTYGWVRPAMCKDGRWSIAPKDFVTRLGNHRGPETGFVLVPRREMAWSNSVRIAGIGDEPVALLHPADAEELGVGEGSWIALSSAYGSMVAAASLTTGIRRGVISVTHGHPGSLTGTVTSSTHEVDPLTAMPRMSGLPLQVTPLAF